MEGLEGKLCAYVIGGHPFRHLNGKVDWDRSVVQWRLLDDFEPPLKPKTYKKKRGKALLALDEKRLHSVLSAEWYFLLWRDKTGGDPKSILQADDFLDQLLQIRLKEASSTEELIRLLAAICGSPWYGLTDTDQTEACQKFFQPSDWPPRVFIAENPLASCPGYNEVWPLCREALEAHVRKAKTVAIDLESDAESIFEFGWKNAAGTGLRTSPTGLSVAELSEAAEECLLKQTAPCVVGHNLLGWDWPILQRHEVPFPESSSLWDTLIASWLLEPWRDSHALVVDENAHRADADAQAMVLLGAMPAENRKEYIDRYFHCEEANDLERLLEDTVGDVDDEVLENNPMLRDLLSQVRRERFSEEMNALNENQLDICRAPFDRTLLVNAGPGSGKTHVLMMRCAHLIHVQRIDPSAILVLAFNRAVVYEIRDRIRTLFRALGYGS